MFILYGIAAGLALGWAAGGSLAGLAVVRIRWLPLIVGALVVQLLIFGPLAGTLASNSLLGLVAFLGSTAAALTAAAVNRKAPGLAMLLTGAGLNAVAIVANGGVMPAGPQALTSLGWSGARDGFSNSGVPGQVSLPWLTDVFAMPPFLPFANVFSLGDVLIAVGGGYFVFRCMRAASFASTNSQASPR